MRSLLRVHAEPIRALLLGGLSSLGFAPLYWFPLYIIGWAWFVLRLTRASSLKCAISLSFFFVYGHFLGGLYWVVCALGVDWHKYWTIAPLVLLGLPLIFVGWYVLAFGAYYRWLRHGKAAPFFAAFVWFVADLCRSYAFTGFPWNLPANIWTFSPALTALTAWIGATGLSLLTQFFVVYAGFWFQSQKRQLFLTIMLFSVLWYGSESLVPHVDMTDLKVHLVQPNIAQVAKMDLRYAQQSLKKLQALSVPPLDDGHLIIWPEGALPFAIDADRPPEGLREYIKSLTADRHTVLISGVRVEEASSQRIYNSLIQVNPKGEVVAHFDKVHLLPFGEFMPLRSLLPQLLADLAVGPVDMTAGDKNAIFVLKAGYRFKPMICFESLFADLIQQDHLDALIIVTNDAWFGNTSGPYQHLSSAQLRAAEFGVPVLRVANTGVSAIIDPYGRLLHKLPYGKEGTMSAKLPHKAGGTFYAQHRWLGVFMILVMFGLLQFLGPRIRIRKEIE